MPTIPSVPPARPEPQPAPSDSKTAAVGAHLKIVGELSGDDDVAVDGCVEGKISVSKSLRIGPTARVTAEIKARNVVIAGQVSGNVTALDRVEILPSGTLEGNISSPKVVIAEGAQFKGSIDMGTKPLAPAGAPGPVDVGSTMRVQAPPTPPR